MSDIIISQNFADFKYNGESYLFNVQPEQDNLFMLTAFYDPAESELENNIEEPWMQYQIKGISFSGVGVGFKEASFSGPLRATLLENVNNVKQVKIDWCDNSTRDVYNYHNVWIKNWYNASGDFLPVGPKGKFRNLTIEVYRYTNTSSGYSPVLEPEMIGTLMVTGLVPESIGEAKLSYDSTGNDATYSITYRCGNAVFTSVSRD